MTNLNTLNLPTSCTDAWIEQMLKRLKLSAIRTNLQDLLRQCEDAKLTPRATLCLLLQAEEQQRDQRGRQMMLRMARFPFPATLDNFDFTVSSLNQVELLELGECEFIKRSENILFRGDSGLGKTHLAIALGRCAINHGFSTQFMTADELFNALDKACREGKLDQRVEKLRQFKLLIIDELGYTLPPRTDTELAPLFYKLMAVRYRSKETSTVITTNRSIVDWPNYFGGDCDCIKATLDRFLEKCHVLLPKGDSYRLRGLIAKYGHELKKEG